MTYVLLYWIGQELEAPVWFWWVWGISVAITIFKFRIDMYDAGKSK